MKRLLLAVLSTAVLSGGVAYAAEATTAPPNMYPVVLTRDLYNMTCVAKYPARAGFTSFVFRGTKNPGSLAAVDVTVTITRLSQPQPRYLVGRSYDLSLTAFALISP